MSAPALPATSPYTRLLLLALLFFFAPAPGQSNPLSTKQILTNFDRIAFGNEFTGERYQWVRKWATPIRMGIQGRYPAYFENDVLQHSAELRALTGHDIQLYYSPTKHRTGTLPPNFDKSKVNVLLFYLKKAAIAKAILKYFDNDPAQVEKMVRQTTCFAKYFKRGHEIRAAVVVFPAHHPRLVMRACVVEELTQILGLPNDSDAVQPSIFNDHSPYLELTAHDRLLLKILYNDKIKVGMPRQQALAVADGLLNPTPPQHDIPAQKTQGSAP